MVRLAVSLAAACLVAVGAVPARAAGTTNPDLQFAARAASGGHAEVEMGRLAVHKAGAPDVRQFGQRMIDDHEKANRQLTELAMRLHLRLPRHAEGKDAAQLKRLSGLAGNAFDRAYVSLMVEDHRQNIADFRDEITNGAIGPIHVFAENTLPILEEHLRLAEQLQRNQSEEKAQVPGER